MELYRFNLVKDLGGGSYSGMSGWAQYNHESPYKRDVGVKSKEKEM